MINTKHGTIRISYRRQGRRDKTIAYFIPGKSPHESSKLFKNDEIDLANKDAYGVFKGIAIVDSRDQFRKVDGRKKAIAKALYYSHLTKTQRTEVWNDVKKMLKGLGQKS